MNTALSANFGRIMIFLAVLLQAIGKVMFGTWLTDIPSPFFVFISFALTAALFLGLSRQGVGETAWGPLLLLNASTALTRRCAWWCVSAFWPAAPYWALPPCKEAAPRHSVGTHGSAFRQVLLPASARS
jgi:hypothetical protein